MRTETSLSKTRVADSAHPSNIARHCRFDQLVGDPVQSPHIGDSSLIKNAQYP